MLGCQSLIRPYFRHHIAGITPDAVITYKNKEGIFKILFAGCRLHKYFKSIIHVSKGIHFRIGPEAIFFQCIFWETTLLNSLLIFLGYCVRAVILSGLNDSDKRF